MPKKTKKQKRHADLHRGEPPEPARVPESPAVNYVLPTTQISEPRADRVRTQSNGKETTARFPRASAVIYTDLRKILVLSVVALAVEFALYWLWEVR